MAERLSFGARIGLLDPMASTESTTEAVVSDGFTVQLGGRLAVQFRPPVRAQTEAVVSEGAGAVKDHALFDIEVPPLSGFEALTAAEIHGLELLAYMASDDYRQQVLTEAANPREAAFPAGCTPLPPEPETESAETEAPAPRMSDRFAGQIAVGILFIDGPGRAALSSDDRRRSEAAVIAGFGVLASHAPAGSVSLVPHVETVTLSRAPDYPGPADPDRPTEQDYDRMEAEWRDPALRALGLSTGSAGLRAFAARARNKTGAERAIAVAFTRYPCAWFGYAMPDTRRGGYLVMNIGHRHYGNVDWLFAHEMAHLFDIPDEYNTPGAQNCSRRYGFGSVTNDNSVHCGSSPANCLMKTNGHMGMCSHTLRQFGFASNGPVADGGRPGGSGRPGGGAGAGTSPPRPPVNDIPPDILPS